MIVVGGTYREVCEFPYDTQLFGPGLRSAAALGEISTATTQLHTYSHSDIEDELTRIANTYEFVLETTYVPGLVSFHYIHNHSHPARFVGRDASNQNLGPITGDAILRFGFVEGDAIVKGERVVYDPQSPDERNFYHNGSEAESLAVVLNQQEARAYTGKENHREMLNSLTSGDDSADVAVVKCGVAGALVHTGDDIVQIPVYETDSVWNIGSGDIFSSIFAVYWAEKEYPPEEAANNASLATAYFCSTRNLPIPSNSEDVDGFEPTKREPIIGGDGPSIYLAAPFFNVGEFWVMEEVQEILSKEGADVISPYHDIGRAEEYNSPTQMAQDDLNALKSSGAVLALGDNCDPGTYLELGHAQQLDIPVIVYMNNPTEDRTMMLEGAGCEVYSDLSTAVFKAIWAA